MLRDAIIGDEAEVDIVMRCTHEDIEVVVSFEVIGWSRKAGRPWVHQQICKHANLPTEKLVLVSWSGFSGPAERVAQATPHVTLMTPRTETVDGVPRVRSLGTAEANLSIRNVALAVTKPDGSSIPLRALPDNVIFDKDRSEVGSVMELANKMVNHPHIGKRVLQNALNHPERDSLRSFVLRLPFDGVDLFLHEEDTHELHRIDEVEITGNLTFKHETFDLTIARLGDVLFGYGETSLAGRSAIVSALIKGDDSIGAGTMRLYTKDNEPPAP